jgi:hypothetical protein
MSQEAPVQTVLACSQCGRAFTHLDLVQIAGNWVCADCKPAFLSRVMASGAAGASPLAWRYGGFWIRFGARFIDGLIFTVPILIVAAVFLFKMHCAAVTNWPLMRGERSIASWPSICRAKSLHFPTNWLSGLAMNSI